MTTHLTQTEARKAIVSSLVAKWDPAYALTGSYDEAPRFTIVDMESAIDEAVKQIQDRLAAPLDHLSNTLWSSETGGTNGSLPKLRASARDLIDAADQITGAYRV
jgi:hypothetical protein